MSQKTKTPPPETGGQIKPALLPTGEPEIRPLPTQPTPAPEPSPELSPEEQVLYETHKQAVSEASESFRQSRAESLRSWGIQPSKGVQYSVYVGGKWRGFGGKELSQWEKQQDKAFFEEILPKYRKETQVVVQQEVEPMVPSPPTQLLSLQSITQQFREIKAQERKAAEAPQPKLYWKTPTLIAVESSKQFREEARALQAIETKPVTYTPYRPRMGLETEVYGYSEKEYKKMLEGYEPPEGYRISKVYKTPEGLTVALRVKHPETPYSMQKQYAEEPAVKPSGPKSLAQQIFEFDVFEAAQEFALDVFGVEDKELRYRLKEQNIMKPIVETAGKGLPMFEEPTKTLAGAVGAGESLVYIAPALMGKEVPYVPTFTGAVVLEAGALISGKGGGDTQRLYEEYGPSYVMGSIAGDVMISAAIGKGIGWARETRIGGKVFDPIMKPLDIAEEYVSKKVIQPIKGKASAFKTKIVGKKPQLTGWERTGFGMEGYGFKEVYGPPEESIFKTSLPSVIKDETGEKFITQTARATSYPTTVTASERTVLGGGKPWLVIMKHPPSLVGGGLTKLVSPTTVTRVPLPAIASLKTKVASQLMKSVAGPAASKFFVGGIVGAGMATARVVTARETKVSSQELIILKPSIPKFIDIKAPVKYMPYMKEIEREKEQHMIIPRTFQAPKTIQISSQLPSMKQITGVRQIPFVTHVSRARVAEVPALTQVQLPALTQIPAIGQLPFTVQVPSVTQAQAQQVAQMTQLETVQQQIATPQQITKMQQQTKQQQIMKPLIMPKAVTAKVGFKAPMWKFPKKRKGKTDLFGGWRLKTHPIPTISEVSVKVVGIPLKKGKKIGKYVV